MKLKLSKTSWLLLFAGFLIVIIAALALTRSQQVREQSRLEEELIKLEMRLNNVQVKELGEKQEELQKALDESISKLAEAKGDLHQPIESIDVTDKFYAIAQSCNTTVNSIRSSGIKRDKLGGIGCSALTVNADVMGEVSYLIDFIIKLNSDFTTGIVKSAQFSIPEGDGEDRPTASITMVVYSY